MRPSHHSRQLGASLLEVLVAILILSFGMLALSGMLAFSVQAPKLAAYRAAATSLAASHIERMRANPAGFRLDAYVQAMTYNTTVVPPTLCAYPDCTPDKTAQLDNYQTHAAIRSQLPQGGMRVTCNVSCLNQDGDIWVIWLEPSTFASLDTANSDECPDPTVAPTFTPFVAPKPRCLHIRFKL